MKQDQPKTSHYDFEKLWSPSIAERGFTRVPNLLSKFQGVLHLTPGEFCILVQIISFRWTNDMPYPSVGLIAKQMGRSTDTVQRLFRSLESKGYIRRVFRPRHVHYGTNEYDLQPLIKKLDELAKLHPNPVKSTVRRLAEMKSIEGAEPHPQVDAAKDPILYAGSIGVAKMPNTNIEN